MSKIKLSKKFNIEDYTLSNDDPIFIIAEAGVSHFGSIKKAYQLVDMAVEANADSIKFQIFDVDEMISKQDVEWKSRMKKRQLSYEKFKKISDYCKKNKIIFSATAHDEKSFKFLQTLNPPFYKIGSGEINNITFQKQIAKAKKPIFFSTGMHNYTDINKSLKAMTLTGNKDIAILHCISKYPTNKINSNLGSITFLKNKFNCIVGYSDHTKGYEVPVYSVFLGSKIIEKHISLDFNVENAQDWKVSCGPHNFKKFVRKVKDAEKIIGNIDKKISPVEISTKKWAMKSLFYKEGYKKGKIIRKNNIVIKRPGSGINPSLINKIFNMKLKVSVAKDTIIKFSDFE